MVYLRRNLKKMDNFIEQVISGDACICNIDDFIEQWHIFEDPDEVSLHEYLGMTIEEYSEFVESPKNLIKIISKRIFDELK